MMPTMDGIETCRALRCDPALKETMVVFLSALGEEEQQLAGFGAGADDYISKPIKPKLLISRIQAILKRVAADKPASLVIDRERHLVIRNGERIELPRKEFALLALLASSPGKLFSREEIYSASGATAWSSATARSTSTSAKSDKKSETDTSRP